MGWWNKREWQTAKQAVDEECRPNDKYEIVWRSGPNVIYRCKEDGHYCHTHFLTRKDKCGIWVKEVSDFRSVAAARKYIALFNEWVKAHPEVDLTKHENIYLRDYALELIKIDDRKKGIDKLKEGDTVYISENYRPNGIATYVGKPFNKKTGYLIKFPDGTCLRAMKKHFDLDKMFPVKVA